MSEPNAKLLAGGLCILGAVLILAAGLTGSILSLICFAAAGVVLWRLHRSRSS